MTRNDFVCYWTVRVAAFVLLAGILVGLMGCESCGKKMKVEGTVVDAITGEPLEGAKVFCCTQGEKQEARVLTESDGYYSFSAENLGGFEGAQVRYEKEGYETVHADRMSGNEAGKARCGSYTVGRSVEMVPSGTEE